MRRLLASLCVTLAVVTFVHAAPRPGTYWNVDDVRAGMKGEGRTVIKGTKLTPFKAEVLGVLRNSSPGRDLILCRLSGANLEYTGVIAGMSGSPVYIDGKLLGAVAYAWPYGKEPIAGVTPFSQMESFVASYESRDLAEKGKPRRIGLLSPLHIDGQQFDRATVASDHSDWKPSPDDGLVLAPLRTPVMATGMSPRSLSLLKDNLAPFGMMPMQGGGVAGNISDEDRNIPLEAGGALSVAMITGDFDMSGIGTVTHIEGKRVYGWGHPFFGAGACDFPLMTGYVHVINPRLSLSFKMGSPLRTVGVINADVSTCIAGWLDRQPDMLPISLSVVREPAGKANTFNVKIVRQKAMLPMLLMASLTNSIDMEGDLPEEMTAQVKLVVDVEGRDPVVLNDTFAGPSIGGNRAPQAMFGLAPTLVNMLVANNFKNLRINRIDCTTEIFAGRRTADLESVELESDILAPGDTLKATAILRPFKGVRQRVPLELKLPRDLPDGSYSATVSDELANARLDLRDNPNLMNPPDLDHLFQSIHLQTAAKRTTLVIRLATPPAGVALTGKSLPNLPGSMVQMLSQTRKTGAQPLPGALVSRHHTDFVLQGQDTIRFTVTKTKRNGVE